LPVWRALLQCDVVGPHLGYLHSPLGVETPEFHALQKRIVSCDPPVELVGGNGMADDLARIYLAVKASCRGQNQQEHAEIV
jgi:hypothetical protein